MEDTKDIKLKKDIKIIFAVLKNKEIHAFIWYFVGNIFVKALAFLTIPLFTNLLSTQEYGYLNTYNAWLGIAGACVGLSLNAAIRSIQKGCEFEEKSFQSSVLFLSFCIFVFFILVGSIVSIIYKLPINVVLLLFIQSYAMFLVTFISQEFILKFNYKKFAFVNTTPPVLALLIAIAIVHFFSEGNRQWAIILPRVGIYCFLALFIFFFVIARGRKLVNRYIWKHSIKYCVPLVFHGFSLTILNQADRIMITSLIGLSETGIYGFTHNFALAVQVVWEVLNNLWGSKFTEFMKHNESSTKINMKAQVYIYIYTLCVIGFIFVSPELIRMIVNENYWGGIPYMAPFILASYINFLYIFPVNNEYHEKQTGVMAWSSLIAAIVNIILNFIAIPLFGGVGAACTTLITYVLLFLIHWKKSNSLNPELFPLTLYRMPCLIVVTMVSLFYLLYTHALLRWLSITVFSILYLLFIIRRNLK